MCIKLISTAHNHCDRLPVRFQLLLLGAKNSTRRTALTPADMLSVREAELKELEKASLASPGIFEQLRGCEMKVHLDGLHDVRQQRFNPPKLVAKPAVLIHER